MSIYANFLIYPPAGRGRRAGQGFRCPFAVVSQLEFLTLEGFAVPFARSLSVIPDRLFGDTELPTTEVRKEVSKHSEQY